MLKQIGFVFLLLFLLASCKEPADLSKNTVVVHLSSQPDGLHPINDNSAMRSHIFHFLHGSLLKTDIRSLEVIPFYAQKLPEISEDQLKYTYYMREDARWDDGSPLTGEDFAFTVKMMLNPFSDNSQLRNFYGSVVWGVELDKKDPLKATMVAHNVHINNLGITTGFYLMQKSHWDPEGIMDNVTFADLNNPDFKTSPEAQNEKFIEFMGKYNHADQAYRPENLVGIGPYRVSEWAPNSYLALERKENWWGDADTLMYNANDPERIIFRFIRDDAAAYLELKNQKIDVTASLGTAKLLKLQQRDYFNKNYYSDFLDQYSFSYIGLNCRPDGIKHKPYFTDKRVRRAMAHLVPVEEIIEVIVYGKATRIITNVNPRKYAFAEHLKPIELDVEKAKALLAEAGWVDTDGNNIVDKVVNGEKLQMSFEYNYFAGHAVTKEIVLMIKEKMYEAGVELRPNPCDFNVFYKKAQIHDFDAMQGGWSGGAAPDDPVQIWSTESWRNQGSNFTGFGNAYSDELITKANQSLDKDVRKKYMVELQEMIYDEQPYIFLYSTKRKVAVHRRFDNARGYDERPGVYAGNLVLKPEFIPSGTNVPE